MATTSIEIDPHGFHVYLLWGTDPHTPLYVGASVNPLGRVGVQMTTRRKSAQVRRLEIRSYHTRTDMRAAEAAAIAQLQPSWNLRGRGPGVERAARQGVPINPAIPVCVNCGVGMSGVGSDRPRKGKCQPCYIYRIRRGTERPPKWLHATRGDAA